MTMRWRVDRRAVMMIGLVAGTACASRTGVDGTSSDPGAPSRGSTRNNPAPPADAVQIYQRMGLIAQGGALPFVGRISYLAGPTPDTTLMVLTLSLPSRAITFARAGDLYEGMYTVTAELLRGTTRAASVTAPRTVSVPNFRETTRGDESVIFQQVLRVAPGSYDLALAVRDSGSERSVSERRPVLVPRLAAGSLSSPIPFYEAVMRSRLDSVPRVLVSARATVTFGRDSLVPIYLESYGNGPAVPVHLIARGENGNVLWRDSLSLERRAELSSDVFQVPVGRLGIGMATLSAWAPGVGDTTRTPLFISFGEALPVASFGDMMNYLRFYSPTRVDGLRDVAVEQRPTAWADFLRDTDPDPTSVVHEGLAQYFARIDLANQRYREEGGSGWLTDRGMAFVAFGDPDQVFEPNPMAGPMQRNRVQVWVYRNVQLQIEFRDQSGLGRWRMTPASESAFMSRVRQLRVR